MTPLRALRKVGARFVAARGRGDAACGVAEGAELVDRVAETAAALVLDSGHARVDVGGSEGAVVGAGVVVVGEGVGSDATLEGVELVGGSAVGGVVDDVLLGRGELVAGLLADEGGRCLCGATRLVRGFGELGAEDGLLPLDGDVLCKGGVASEAVLDLVGVVSVLPVVYCNVGEVSTAARVKVCSGWVRSELLTK